MLTPVINDYRRELRPRILAAAAEMFRVKGIRAVKMDDIAHQLTISKRTLYEIYPNKEELVVECLKLQMEEHEAAFRAIIPDNANTMDILILFLKKHFDGMARLSPALYDDLVGYPRLKKMLDERRQRNAENVKHFFMRGIDEGFFMPDYDIELAHRMNMILSDQIRAQRLHNDFAPDRIFRFNILIFIRSFCTIKGIEMLDKALAEMKS